MRDQQETLADALRFQREGRLDEAEEIYRQMLAEGPRQAAILNNLANIFKDSGRIEEAVELCRQAMDLEPGNAEIHSSLCYKLHFHPGYDRAAIFRECREWDNRNGGKAPLEHRNERSPDRRLKIGYVSPDFYGHAECFFVLPLLQAHDRENFEIHLYSSVRTPDRATEIIRNCADVWHDVKDLTDSQLAQKINSDRVDILIDLTMHMAFNRLPMFAMKPVPVQATWLAYPGGTGLGAIDYRITDEVIDPRDDAANVDAYYSEKSLRLANGWCCYHPLGDLPPAAEREPGAVTFGSLNNPCKLNRPTLGLWAKVLAAAADSNLVLLAESRKQRGAIAETFAAAGVDPGRIEFVGRQRRREYLRLYDRIDICLDPLVYNGITTTCDALWMGVPVISRIGETGPGRAGASILSRLDLRQCIGESDEDFIAKALALAEDFAGRRELRQNLRRRMVQSPLMDRGLFARNMEAAYHQMWRDYCSGGSPPV